MRKILAGTIMMITAVSLAACKKDDQVRTTLSDLDSFTAELVKRVESASDPSSGLDEAQKYMESKKSEIKPKLDAIKTLRGFEVSDEIKKSMQESVSRNVASIAGLRIKYVSRSVSDAAFKNKLEKLVNDYTQMITS